MATPYSKDQTPKNLLLTAEECTLMVAVEFGLMLINVIWLLVITFKSAPIDFMQKNRCRITKLLQSANINLNFRILITDSVLLKFHKSKSPWSCWGLIWSDLSRRCLEVYFWYQFGTYRWVSVPGNVHRCEWGDLLPQCESFNSFCGFGSDFYVDDFCPFPPRWILACISGDTIIYKYKMHKIQMLWQCPSCGKI